MSNKAFRISKLEAQHVVRLNTLSPTVPQTVAQHASLLGITPFEATKRLSLLVDEGLATQSKDAHGKPTGQYQYQSL